MKVIPDFLIQLKRIDNDFNIIVNPRIPDMAGVYWKDEFVCGLPSTEIYEELKPDYKNSAGLRHRTAGEVLSICKRFIERIKHEKGFLELIQDKTI